MSRHAKSFSPSRVPDPAGCVTHLFAVVGLQTRNGSHSGGHIGPPLRPATVYWFPDDGTDPGSVAAGLQDAERAKRLIGQTAMLEWRLIRQQGDVVAVLGNLDEVLKDEYGDSLEIPL